MPKENVKCPICGTLNEGGTDKCKMCQTQLSKEEDGKLKVRSPKGDGKIYSMIDIEDPRTRKRLEELTLIPGVSRRKALYLYQSGIHSMEEFLEKAFKGEKYAENFSRTVANKLLLQSLRGGSQKEEIPCPSCKAPNPPDAEKCNVCNYEISAEMDAIDMENISSDISDSVTDIIGELSEDEDFDALPEEMKSKFAWAIESDDDDVVDIDRSIEALGIDLEEIDDIGGDVEEEPAESAAEPDTKTRTGEPEAPAHGGEGENTETEEQVEVAPKPKEKPAEPRELTAKEKKIRKVLSKKVDQWRKAGYDVEGLEDYLHDVEGFKVKAKEALEKGKVIRAKYEKQMEMWREKGFDVSELEPLLDKDIDQFKDRAKEVLKQQKR